MEEQLKKYLKKTENLLNLLHFFSRKEAVPENLEAVYVDFYLRNIIATNYTNFENYLRSCLIVMAEALSEVDFLKESDISEELAIDFIKHCVDQFPHEKKIHTLVGSKSSLVKNLHDMVINKRFKVNIPESTFTQMPHSVAEIEKLLCKYFKQKQILYDILLPIEKEEAFSS
ncbi:MAG TPA: hypothetical protein DCY94_00570, partial [Firmicutes bacterium]|nr:hypothetical protein [Bacillota bacterium]